jgi:hypothetical protein
MRYSRKWICVENQHSSFSPASYGILSEAEGPRIFLNASRRTPTTDKRRLV